MPAGGLGRVEQELSQYPCPILKNFQVPIAITKRKYVHARPTRHAADAQFFGLRCFPPPSGQLNPNLNPKPYTRIVSSKVSACVCVCVFGFAVLRVSCSMKLHVAGQKNGLLSLRSISSLPLSKCLMRVSCTATTQAKT